MPNTVLPSKLGYYNLAGDAEVFTLDNIDARKVYKINKIPIETDSIKDEDNFGIMKDDPNATQYRRFYNVYKGNRKYTITLTNEELLIENAYSSHNLLVFDNNEDALAYYLALRTVD